MARQTNGVDQYLHSASAIDLSAYTKGAYAFWLWADSYGNVDNHYALTQARDALPRVEALPDTNGGGWRAGLINDATTIASITRPSAGAWHHYVINLDITKSSGEIDTLYVDGVAASLSFVFDQDNTGNLPNRILDLMTTVTGGSPAGLLAGRIAEVAIWGGILLAQADVDNLYNSGGGRLATDVQSGSLVHYWRIEGDTSPEPASVGGIDLTVVGATSVAHPFTLTTNAGAVASPFFRIKRKPWG